LDKLFGRICFESRIILLGLFDVATDDGDQRIVIFYINFDVYKILIEKFSLNNI